MDGDCILCRRTNIIISLFECSAIARNLKIPFLGATYRHRRCEGIGDYLHHTKSYYTRSISMTVCTLFTLGKEFFQMCSCLFWFGSVVSCRAWSYDLASRSFQKHIAK